MLFVVTAYHSPENCPANDKKRLQQLRDEWAGHKKKEKAARIEILGSYLAAPEHTFYFIIQADSYDGIVSFFGLPWLTTNSSTVTPVQTLDAAFGPALRKKRR